MVKSTTLPGSWKIIILFVLGIGLHSTTYAQTDNSVSIGTDELKSNAVLYLKGNGNQGLIIPVVANLSDIALPEAGMIVYSGNNVHYHNGSAWVAIGSDGGGGASYDLTFDNNTNTLELLENGVAVATINIPVLPDGSNEGQVVTFDGNNWVAAFVDELQGFNLPTVTELNNTTGQKVLVFDGDEDQWKLITIPSGGGATTLEGLDNVNAGATNGQVLVFNSTSGNWEPQTLNVDDADASSTNEIQNLSGVLTEGNDAGEVTITNLPEPVQGSDAATKDYVDSRTGFNGDYGNLSNVPADLADGDDVDDADADPANELQTISLSGNDIILSDGGGTVTLPTTSATVTTDATLSGDGSAGDPLSVVSVDDADADPSNEVQDLSFSAGQITLSGDPTPTTIDLSNYDIDASDDFSGNFGDLSGIPAGLSDGDDVNDADADPVNELQTISLSGNDLILSDGGGTVTLPTTSATVTTDATLSGDGSAGDPLSVISVDDADADATNEIQDLTFSAGQITLSGDPTPTTIDLSNYDTDASDDFSGDFGDLSSIPADLLDGDDVGLTSVNTDASLSGDGSVGSPLSVASLDDADADPVNELQTISLSGNDLILSDGGGTVTLPTTSATVTTDATLSGDGSAGDPLSVVSVDDADADATNEIQDLAFSAGQITLSGDPTPTTINLSNYDTDASDDFSGDFGDLSSIPAGLLDGDDVGLTSINTDASLSGDGSVGSPLSVTSVDDADADAANEIQDLAFSAGQITLSGDPTPTTIDLSNYDSDASDDFSGNFGDLSSIPAGLLDGDDVGLTSVNTDASLSGDGTVGSPLSVTSVDDADADATNEIQDLQSVLSQGANANNTIIKNAGDPVDVQDVATKNYIDTEIGALSTLPSTTDAQIIVSDGTNPTAVSMTGDVTISNTGVTTINSSSVGSTEIADGSITNADINDVAAAKVSGLGTLATKNTISATTDISTTGATSGQIIKFNGTSWILDNGANKWKDGTTVPNDADGELNGTYYLNTNTGDVYVKNSGTYTQIANLQGADGVDGDKYTTASTTSETINAGTKTFVVDPNLAYAPNQGVIISSTASPANFIDATVDSYNTGTGQLVVTTNSVTGSGTFADWTIALSGAPGPAGEDAYIYVGYADDNSGSNFNTSPGTREYIAFRTSDTDLSPLDGSEFSTWNKFRDTQLASANIYVGDGSNLRQEVPVSGDVNLSNTGATTVTAIQGHSVTATTPTADDQVLKWNTTTSTWELGTDNGESYTAGTGIDISSGVISNTGDGDSDVTNEIQDLSGVLSQSNDAGTLNISNLGDPVNPQDAATKAYVDANSGGTQDLQSVLTQGNDAGGNTIVNVGTPTNNNHAATKEYVDNITLANVVASGNSAGNSQIIDVADPSNPQDAATKAYVDSNVNQTLQEVLDVGNDAGGNTIENVGNPINTNDAANKGYVDANDDVDDDDADASNELNSTFAVNAGNLELTDAGGTLSVPLTSIQDGVGATSLSELTDASVATATDGQLMIFDGITDNQFENVSISGDISLSSAGVTTLSTGAGNNIMNALNSGSTTNTIEVEKINGAISPNGLLGSDGTTTQWLTGTNNSIIGVDNAGALGWITGGANQVLGTNLSGELVFRNVHTDVRDAATALNTGLVTEKAVRDAIDASAGVSDLQGAYEGGGVINLTASTNMEIISSDANNIFTIDEANERIGIGTNAPLSKLDIIGSSATGVATSIQNINSAGWASFNLRNDIGSLFSLSVGGSTAANAADKFYIFNNGAPRFVLDQSGNIGIATTDPVTSLQISDRLHIFQDSDNSTVLSNNLYLSGGTTPTPTYTADGEAGVLLIGGSSLKFINAPAGTAGNAATVNEIFTITDEGKLVLKPLTKYGISLYADNINSTTSEFHFHELDANGSDFVGFRAPDDVTSTAVWTLPAADGLADQILKTDGAGNLSWISPAGVTASNGLTASGSSIALGGSLTGVTKFTSTSNAQFELSSSSASLGTKAGFILKMDDGYTGDVYELFAEKGDATANSGASDFILKKNFSTAGGDIRLMKIDRTSNNIIFNESNTSSNSYGNVIFANGNIGIGSVNPMNLLDVEGGMTIGEGYSGTNLAPANGLLVEGIVGIGTTAGLGSQKVRVSAGTGTIINEALRAENAYTGSSTSTGVVGQAVGSTGTGGRIGISGYAYGHGSLSGTATGVYSEVEHEGSGNTYLFRGDVAIASTGIDYGIYLSNVEQNYMDGNLGIGTTNPTNKLDVEGGVAIGTSYSGSNTAPPNGLIVEGNVGLGSTGSSSARLDILTDASIQRALSITAYENYGFYSTYNHSNSVSGFGIYQSINHSSTANTFGMRIFYNGLGSGTKYGVTVANENYNYFTGNTMLGGQADAVNKLDVEGGVAIGASYSGTNTAPLNGLIVEGPSAFGTSSPSSVYYFEIENNTSTDYFTQYIDVNYTGSTTSYGLYISSGATAATTEFGIYVSGATNNFLSGDLNISGTYSNTSDLRFKKNINNLTNSLEKITALQGVEFDWRREEFEEKEFSKRRQIGFIAQDVEEILPELVLEDEEGFKSVAYSNLTAVIVEAIKEQQALIEQQQKEIDALKQKLAESEKEPVSTDDLQLQINQLKAQLDQLSNILKAEAKKY